MKKIVILMAILSIACSCSQKASKPVGLGNSPVVAQRMVTPLGDTLVVANMDLMIDTIDFPMSLLFSDFEVVKLEDNEDALIGDEISVFVSSNHIGVSSYSTGYKLFDKQGHFITSISKRGQGPDEYSQSIYDSLIDEENRRIYLSTLISNKMLAFDFEGNACSHITLPFEVGKTRIRFSQDGERIYFAHQAQSEEEPAYWIQDLQGNILQELRAGHLASLPDFSNELSTRMNNPQLDYAVGYFYDERVDTLYHYSEEANRMMPVFTTNLDCISSFHEYIELPDYYCIFVNGYFGEGWRGYALIDKHTLKGSYVRFKLDMLGDIDIPRGNMIDHGYYKTCIHPYVLQEQWMKKGEISGLPDGIARFVKYLQTHDVEEMNNVVLIGKLKQSHDEEFVLHDMNFND